MILWLATGCMWGLIACVLWNASAALPCYRGCLSFQSVCYTPKARYCTECIARETALFYLALPAIERLKERAFCPPYSASGQGCVWVYPQEIPNCPAILRFWVTLSCEGIVSLTPCPNRAWPDTFMSKTCLFILIQLVDPAVPSDIILGQSLYFHFHCDPLHSQWNDAPQIIFFYLI